MISAGIMDQAGATALDLFEQWRVQQSQVSLSSLSASWGKDWVAWRVENLLAI